MAFFPSTFDAGFAGTGVARTGAFTTAAATAIAGLATAGTGRATGFATALLDPAGMFTLVQHVPHLMERPRSASVAVTWSLQPGH